MCRSPKTTLRKFPLPSAFCISNRQLGHKGQCQPLQESTQEQVRSYPQKARPLSSSQAPTSTVCISNRRLVASAACHGLNERCVRASVPNPSRLAAFLDADLRSPQRDHTVQCQMGVHAPFCAGHLVSLPTGPGRGQRQRPPRSCGHHPILAPIFDKSSIHQK